LPEFVALQAMSHYSLGRGTLPIAELVQHAGRLGHRHLALTDVENLYGQVRFHATCRAHGIRPITGVELTPPGWLAPPGLQHRRPGRLVLLAPDERAYAELCRIVTQRRANPCGMPDTFEGSAGHALWLSDEPWLLRELVRRLGPAPVRALVIRPRPTAPESEIIALARELGVALVASLDVASLHGASLHVASLDGACVARSLPDALSLDEGELRLRRLVMAVALERRSDELPGELVARGGTLLAPAAATALFADLPEAVLETRAIAESCTLDLLELGGRRPRRPELARELGQRCLGRLAAGGSARRSAAYHERVRAELDVIEALGLAECFTSVAELVEAARARAISLTARGSAVSSLVGHLLGFSPIDPLEQGLYFERFASEARRSPPDIDLEVASRRRDELVEWLIRSRGGDRTARVSSLQRFQRRSAYRAGLRALGAPREVLERFLEHLPPDELGDAGPSLALWSRYLPWPWRGQLGLIERLIGVPRQLALHPGGVVLAHQRLDGALALERTSSGALATQYDAESLARLGFVKVDLLGSHCLDELDEIRRARRERRSNPRDVSLDDVPLDDIPLDDAATFELIDRADTIGCYQLESPAQRAVLARLPVRRLDDVTHALAIVRPGPASGQAKELFLARARGEAGEPELHPLLAERLRATHGLLLYEEDILFLLAQLAGLPLSTAEALRVKLQEHADDPAWLERARQRFSARAEQRGIPLESAAQAWSDVLRFVRYSFNKAHATSQARLAYQSAFLKCNAPLEHGCALLNHHGGLYPRRVIAADLLRHGVRLLLPSLRRSGLDCARELLEEADRGGAPPCGGGAPPCEGGAPPYEGGARPCEAEPPREGGSRAAIRIGLSLIKGLRARTRQHLLASRPALERGFARTLRTSEASSDPLPGIGLRRAEWRALLRSGACDELLGLGAADYPWVHEALLSELDTDPERTPALPLSPRGPAALAERIARAREQLPREPAELVERYRALSRVQNELRYLEMHVSDHPMRILRREAERLGCIPSDQLREHVGRHISFAGVIAAARRVPLARAAVAQFLTLEDELGLVEARLSPAAYARLTARVSTPGPFLVQARALERQGAVYLAIDELVPFHERPPIDPLTSP
jgi:error-prone DNA polymerase